MSMRAFNKGSVFELEMKKEARESIAVHLLDRWLMESYSSSVAQAGLGRSAGALLSC